MRWKSRASPCAGSPDDRRTLTVTRKHLEDALDALSTAVSASLGSAGDRLHAASGRGAKSSSGSATPAGLAGRLAELALHADTLADIARTLSAERGDDASAEVLACAEAVHASLQSHQRDFEQLMPWAKLVAAETALAAPANAADDISPEQALARIFDSVPTLADLPDRCEAAMLILTQRRAELAAQNERARATRSSCEWMFWSTLSSAPQAPRGRSADVSRRSAS